MIYKNEDIMKAYTSVVLGYMAQGFYIVPNTSHSWGNGDSDKQVLSMENGKGEAHTIKLVSHSRWCNSCRIDTVSIDTDEKCLQMFYSLADDHDVAYTTSLDDAKKAKEVRGARWKRNRDSGYTLTTINRISPKLTKMVRSKKGFGRVKDIEYMKRVWYTTRRSGDGTMRTTKEVQYTIQAKRAAGWEDVYRKSFESYADHEPYRLYCD